MRSNYLIISYYLNLNEILLIICVKNYQCFLECGRISMINHNTAEVFTPFLSENYPLKNMVFAGFNVSHSALLLFCLLLCINNCRIKTSLLKTIALLKTVTIIKIATIKNN